jgi:hypothetical protein
MFKLFEKQPNWALKQLVQETDQPAVCFFGLLFSTALESLPTLILVYRSFDVHTYMNVIKVS